MMIHRVDILWGVREVSSADPLADVVLVHCRKRKQIGKDSPYLPSTLEL